jgi:hypothetical protein
MSPGRRWCSITLVIVTSWLMAGCGDPPNKEIQQAQQAIDSARAVGADRYAADEFTAAEDALKHAQAAVVARDYRQALNDALDSRDRAQTAARPATDKKETARANVDQALHTTALAIIDARGTLRLAEAARRPRALTLALRREIADAETRVQEARTAFDQGDYLGAGDVLQKTQARLNDAVRGAEGAGLPAAKRRR